MQTIVNAIKNTSANGQTTVEKVNPVWKVSYVHLEDRAFRRPFFKRTALAQARTREEAIARVSDYVGSFTYGEFRASKAAGARADVWFRDAEPIRQNEAQNTTPDNAGSTR